eukprot:6751956-Pyramimonas_sp.AAC.1
MLAGGMSLSTKYSARLRNMRNRRHFTSEFTSHSNWQGRCGSIRSCTEKTRTPSLASTDGAAPSLLMSIPMSW